MFDVDRLDRLLSIPRKEALLWMQFVFCRLFRRMFGGRIRVGLCCMPLLKSEFGIGEGLPQQNQ